MCQIQFVKRIDGNNLDENDLHEFDKLMLLGNKYNHDAWGIITKNYSTKGYSDFDMKDIDKKKCMTSNFIIGHNRLSTSGDTSLFREFIPFAKKESSPKVKKIIDNSHPFSLQDFLLMHNGHIANYKKLKKEFNINTDIKTDSYIVLALINELFLKSKCKSRKEKVIEAINKTCNKLEGTFSVFLYDKQDNEIYYFKDNITDFSFRIIENKYIIGSTSNDNLGRIYINKEKEDEEFYPLGGKVYVINKESLIIEKQRANKAKKFFEVEDKKYFHKFVIPSGNFKLKEDNFYHSSFNPLINGGNYPIIPVGKSPYLDRFCWIVFIGCVILIISILILTIFGINGEVLLDSAKYQVKHAVVSLIKYDNAIKYPYNSMAMIGSLDYFNGKAK